MKDGQGFARQVTSENLEQFAPLLGHKSESSSTESPDSQATREKALLDPELQAAEALFSGISIKVSIPARFSVSKKTRRNRLSKPGVKARGATPLPATVISQGQLIWEKKDLPATDVQRQQGNPTGSLRLVQKKWEVEGKKIDQTTYFRKVIFGKLNWTIGTHKPIKRETALITFVVRILGEDYGERKLVVSHKPSGEARQRNFTTALHWGDLASTIKELNLVGKTFRLYAPPENQQEPFFIEII
jgi:hypothetical protein